jgi:gamma-glutamyl:cysteine ligase YbdK (ATP-grasp superfamily)
VGIPIDRDQFTEADFERFAARLQHNLTALRELLQRPGFGRGPQTIGAELEVNIVDARGRALPVNRRILADSIDSRLQLEIDRFNLEYNLEPISSRGEPFSALERQLTEALRSMNEAAAKHGGEVITIGILPTLTRADLDHEALTDLPRYRALAAGMRRLRNAPFQINISGEDHLVTVSDTVSLEGGNTSFQVHLRVDPERFADSFNAAQLAAPLVLAVTANSPLFLGHRLWDETRIALFKQAVDSRSPTPVDWRRAARVPFGHGWLRRCAYELFSEAVCLFPPIMPVCAAEDPLAELAAGRIPELTELRLHQSTIWQWNRAIFDPSAGSHLRIELRAMPSGPTPLDMAANAAFAIGLIVGLRRNIDELLPALPFQYAEYNFYRAAQHGLDAQLLWPSLEPLSPREHSVRALIGELLPTAAEGLAELGVTETETSAMLGIIEARLATGLTGARWQRRMLARLEARLGREEALAELVRRYMIESRSARPVHSWSDAA